MSDVLKGNFTPKHPVTVTPEAESLTDRFEREALKRLGGSVAYVSKKQFLFGADEAPKEDG